MPFDATPIETKPAVFSLDGLIAWLETQDPEETYNPDSSSDCLWTRYFRQFGIERSMVSGSLDTYAYGGHQDGRRQQIAIGGNGLSYECTYRAALTRAKQLRGY